MCFHAADRRQSPPPTAPGYGYGPAGAVAIAILFLFYFSKLVSPFRHVITTHLHAKCPGARIVSKKVQIVCHELEDGATGTQHPPTGSLQTNQTVNVVGDHNNTHSTVNHMIASMTQSLQRHVASLGH
jgi:hypothetical protein